MLTGLTMLSWACKCVNFTKQNITKGERDPMKLNFDSLEMQKWNIPTDRAQRVDRKNEDICLVIIFTPQVMVIRMSKIAHLLYFLLMPAKNQSQFSQNIYVDLKDLI